MLANPTRFICKTEPQGSDVNVDSIQPTGSKVTVEQNQNSICENQKLIDQNYLLNEIYYLKQRVASFEQAALFINQINNKPTQYQKDDNISKRKFDSNRNEVILCHPNSECKKKKISSNSNFSDVSSNGLPDINEQNQQSNEETYSSYNLESGQPKKVHVFSLKLSEPLNYEVWLGFKNENKMTKQQLFECNRVIDYSKKLITDEFNLHTAFNGIRKTDFGYTVNRQCTKNGARKCLALWTIHIDLFRQKTSVVNNKPCDHTERIKITRNKEQETPLHSKNRFTFSLSSENQLNKFIWMAFKNTSNNSCLDIEQIENIEQLIECKKLIDYSEKLILDQFKHNSLIERIRKTPFGYTLVRKCPKNLSLNNCKTRWTINLYVDKHEVLVSCSRICSHTIAKNVNLRVFKFRVMPEFNLTAWQSISNSKYYHVSVLDLNDSQKNEIQKLKDFSQQLIVKEFNRRTFCNQIKKTANGFLVLRYCSAGKRNCRMIWSVDVDLFKNQATINFNKMCEHLES